MLTIDQVKTIKDCEAQGIPLSSMHRLRSKYNVKVRTRPGVARPMSLVVPPPLAQRYLARAPAKETTGVEEPYSPFADRRACSSNYGVEGQSLADGFEVPLRYAHSDGATMMSDPFGLDDSSCRMESVVESLGHAQSKSQLTNCRGQNVGSPIPHSPTTTRSPYKAPEWPMPVAISSKQAISPPILRSMHQSSGRSQDSSFSAADVDYECKSERSRDSEPDDLNRLSAIREESSTTSQRPIGTRTDRLLATFVINNDHDQLQAWRHKLGAEEPFEYMRPGTTDSRGSINSAVSTIYKMQYL